MKMLTDPILMALFDHSIKNGWEREDENGILWRAVSFYHGDMISEKGECRFLGSSKINQMNHYTDRKLFIDTFIAVIDSHIEYKNSFADSKKNTEGYIYFVHTKHGTKIGLSSNPSERTKSIFSGLPFRSATIYSYKVYDMRIAEYSLHKIFIEKHLNAEWFDIDMDNIRAAIKYLSTCHNGEHNFTRTYKGCITKLGSIK